jgi:hypothetical protein
MDLLWVLEFGRTLELQGTMVNAALRRRRAQAQRIQQQGSSAIRAANSRYRNMAIN